MRKVFFIFIILFSIQSVKAQENGIALEGAYTYKFLNKSLSQFYLGGVYSYSSGNRGYSSYDDQFTFGLGTYYGSYKGQEKWIPAASFGYGGGIGLMYKATVTTHNVMPSVNLNMFNIAQLGLGYSFGFKKINNVSLSGICLTINLSLNIFGHYVNIST